MLYVGPRFLLLLHSGRDDSGMPDLVGLCAPLRAAQGHFPHRCERRTAACGMRARRQGRRGALLVRLVVIVDMRGVGGLHLLRRAGRPCRTLPGVGDCFSMHPGPIGAPDTARLAVPIDIPTPSSTSLVPAQGGSAETHRPWRRRGKRLAYRLSSLRRSVAGGALNAPYFLIPWPTHLCSAGPMSWLSCSTLPCAQIATRTLRAARTRAYEGTEAVW